MRLSFLFILLQFFVLPHFLCRLHLLHRLHLFYYLSKLCLYLRLLLLRVLISTIHRRVPSCSVCKSMRLICMRCESRACVQAILRWPLFVVTMCYVIPTLRRGLNVGCSVVDNACLFPVARVRRLIFRPAAIKRSNMWKIFCALCKLGWKAVTPNWSIACSFSWSV